MKKVAILIDGGFLSKCYFLKNGKAKHITKKSIIALSNGLIEKTKEEIFRIYYYDAPPFSGTAKNPLDKSVTDYSKISIFPTILNFQRSIAETEFVALRRGELAYSGWKIKDGTIEKIMNGTFTGSIGASDIQPNFRQKGVDMRIGLDIAWLSTKRIVDKLILVTADNDFIPAMKFARKEGLNVTICKIHELTSEMRQHSDQIIERDLTKF